MPATTKGITTALGILRGANLQNGPDLGKPEAARLTLESWLSAFDDVSDEALCVACRNWVKAGEGPWWPVPSQLRPMMPRTARPALTDRGEVAAEARKALDLAARNQRPDGRCLSCSSEAGQHRAECPIPWLEARAA